MCLNIFLSSYEYLLVFNITFSYLVWLIEQHEKVIKLANPELILIGISFEYF